MDERLLCMIVVYVYMCDFPIQNWCKIEMGMCKTLEQDNFRWLETPAETRSIIFSAVCEQLSKIGPNNFR
jgi:hypothetical protein